MGTASLGLGLQATGGPGLNDMSSCLRWPKQGTHAGQVWNTDYEKPLPVLRQTSMLPAIQNLPADLVMCSTVLPRYCQKQVQEQV